MSKYKDHLYSAEGRPLVFLEACSGKNLVDLVMKTGQQYPASMVDWCRTQTKGHWRFEWRAKEQVMTVHGTREFVHPYAVFYFQYKSDALQFRLAN